MPPQRADVSFDHKSYCQSRALSVKKSVIIAAAIAAFGFVSSASAADMPTKAPMAPLPVAYNWTGFYLGAHGGYGWANSDWTFQNVSFFNTFVGDQINLKPKGGLGGGQVGYNYQIGQFLLGVEGTFSWADIKQTVTSPIFPTTDNETTKIKNLYTVAARLGVTNGPWLAYAKGGWAGGRVQLSAAEPGIAVSWDPATQSRSGFVIGGGVEYMIAPSIILGAEYNYIDLGSKTYSAVNTPSAFGPTTVSDKTTVSTIIGRVSYLFNIGR
jgi:outer membrane immunogenic protein